MKIFISAFSKYDLDKLSSSLEYINIPKEDDDISELSEIMSKHNSDKGFGLAKVF